MIKVLSYTKNPISFMGKCAGVCQNANIEDEKKNFKRGVECINSGHGRVLEYPDFTISIEGYSARVIREFYTHIGGSPTRLQSSTRYINYDEFAFFAPKSIRNNDTIFDDYCSSMQDVFNLYKKMIDSDIPREDIANILPLGMATTICVKMNTRTFTSMCEKRLCKRAYHEFQDLVKNIKNTLSSLDDEWKLLCDKVFLSECDKTKSCKEKNGCGKYKKADVLITKDEMELILNEK